MSVSAVMRGRVAIIVAGQSEYHHKTLMRIVGKQVAYVDCCEFLPRDPQAQRDYNYINSVATQSGFTDALTAAVDLAAGGARLIVVACRRGKHRSPVVGAATREVLVMLGFSVTVVELQLIQPFLLERMLLAVVDWSNSARIFGRYMSTGPDAISLQRHRFQRWLPFFDFIDGLHILIIDYSWGTKHVD